MIIFKVDNNVATDDCSVALSSLNWGPDDRASAVVKKLQKGKPTNCSDITTNDVSELVCLGHSNTQMYGDFTAKEFVQALVKQLEKSKVLAIKDLYLIGCEVGFINVEGTSLAQSIADELKKQGFIIRIHAFAYSSKSSQKIPLDSMGVGVIDKQAIYSNERGYIQARYYNEAETSAIPPEKRNTIVAMPSEIGQEILVATHPKLELDKPNNIFLGGETVEQRQVRLITANAYQAKLDKMLALLKNQITHKQHSQKQNDEKLTYFINLRFKLQASLPAEWMALLNEAYSYFEKKAIVAYTSPSCEVIKDCIEICKTLDVVKTQESLPNNSTAIVTKTLNNAQDKSPQNATVSEARSASPIKEITSICSKTKSLEPSSLSRKNSFSMILGHSDIGLLEEDSPNYESQDREETNNSARDHHYTSAHHIELLAAKKASARKMVTCLENEISDLKKRNCLIQFFYCYEINTKLRKVQALKNLLQCRSYPELVEAAMQASTVTRVNRSWRTSRTRDLLDEIIYQADAEDLAIVDEHRSLISKKEKLTAKIR